MRLKHNVSIIDLKEQNEIDEGEIVLTRQSFKIRRAVYDSARSWAQNKFKQRKWKVYTNYLHRVSKNCAKLFLSELCQIFTNFDNLLQKDGKETKIMQGALISHLS